MILVFGKSGQVATELGHASDTLCLGRMSADLRDPGGCVQAVERHRPDAVVNAAAYTAVDAAEDEEALANVINGEAPTALARVSARMEIPFIHISTDYVFDGSGEGPRGPEDATAPINAYGRSKLAGERGVMVENPDAVILRTSWVFSPHGSNFLRTMLRLSETRDSLRIVADQVGGPTPARAIAAACLEIAAIRREGEGTPGIHHFSGLPDVSWADFAREIFRLAKRDVDVTDIATSEYPTPAPRPLNSRLDCTSLSEAYGIDRPDWRSGARDVLKELEFEFHAQA